MENAMPLFSRWPGRGFTLIELLVSMAIIAVLLSLAVPQYFGRVEHAKEVVLRENLYQMREALDKYYGDRNRYPDTLNDLVSRKYLRKIPIDPVTGSDRTWITLAPADARLGAVSDVKSGADGNGRDGTPYSSW
jgi:general secretion pathway protein G